MLFPLEHIQLIDKTKILQARYDIQCHHMHTTNRIHNAAQKHQIIISSTSAADWTTTRTSRRPFSGTGSTRSSTTTGRSTYSWWLPWPAVSRPGPSPTSPSNTRTAPGTPGPKPPTTRRCVCHVVGFILFKKEEI